MILPEEKMARARRTHGNKVKKAREAIEAVFCDTGVSQLQTRESLRELRGEIDESIAALVTDGIS